MRDEIFERRSPACGAQTQSEERHGDTEGVFDEE